MARKRASMMKLGARSPAASPASGLPLAGSGPVEDPLTVAARLLCAQAGRAWLSMAGRDRVETSQGVALIVMTPKQVLLLEPGSEQKIAAIPNICT